ncbi:class I SAM-dependent methyltransferase [Pararhizobium mangrovi]|uniref:Methyltransferase domain-containing protein n=1 Tax=Pararhizobium mangrovi TaxID=2590452 RepID=A0A506UEP8_9HYPH|nr:class I SAM-dependent methyltransferase [Pararhizobium mangrovi]TPW31249.1 methyltransferase domain-containing protein [Pararhizobium mangrovi]
MEREDGYETVVGTQFGSRADAYLESTVHAGGEDLAAIVAQVAERPGLTVLDLGCGGGHVTFNAAPHAASVTAYDVAPQMLAVVERAAAERGLSNVKTRRGVAEALPFDDASFDIVLTRLSAHHWSDFAKGIGEAARVLKPGGIVGFADTLSPGRPMLDTYLQTIETLRDCSHVRCYAHAEWIAAMTGAGLRVGEARQYRLRLDFDAWIERMKTPQVQTDAIRALQKSVASEATGYFETEADGSFTIDVGWFSATKPSS